MTDDDEPFYPGSTSVRRSQGGEGLTVPDTEPEPWEEMGKTWLRDGKPVVLYQISALAEALERSVQTVRHWDQDKILPEADNRTDSASPNGRRRLYTHAQIAGLRQIAKDEGLMNGKRVYVTRTNFSQRAVELFDELDGQ